MSPATTDDGLLDVLHWLWTTSPDRAVEARARELLLDTIGCAIAGIAEPEVAALFASADPGPISFPGTTHRLAPTGFAMAFAAAACWHEACEGLAAAHGRPGLHAIPVALGLALARGTPLRALLDAILVGYELGGRLGMLCRIRPGMHVDGTWGSFAAAAASSRLLGATPAQALGALQHAACHMPFSLYWPIAAGSVARNAYAGHGAMHGLNAARAALAGLEGPPGSIDEMLRLALGREPQGLPGPGRILLQEAYLKPYPAVRHVHYGAAAAEAWRGDPASITAITLSVYEEAVTYCGNRAPETAIQAQFSLSYGVARSLVHGTLDPRAYTREALADPPVRRLEALVALRPDPAATNRSCTLEIRTGDGIWRRTVDTLPPMTRPQILDKFRAYASPVIGAGHAASIAVRVLEGAPDAPLCLDA